MQNFEKDQNWVMEKGLTSGQWNFSCRYMLRSSPCMQNLMIVRLIVWEIWSKDNFFLHFLGIFKTFLTLKSTINLIKGLKFCMNMPPVLGNLYENFGATGTKRLAVARQNVLRCLKTQNFAPLFSYFWAVILSFWVIGPS